MQTWGKGPQAEKGQQGWPARTTAPCRGPHCEKIIHKHSIRSIVALNQTERGDLAQPSERMSHLSVSVIRTIYQKIRVPTMASIPQILPPQSLESRLSEYFTCIAYAVLWYATQITVVHLGRYQISMLCPLCCCARLLGLSVTLLHVFSTPLD